MYVFEGVDVRFLSTSLFLCFTQRRPAVQPKGDDFISAVTKNRAGGLAAGQAGAQSGKWSGGW